MILLDFTAEELEGLIHGADLNGVRGRKNSMNIYEIRKAGREYCQAEGSEHYKADNKLEPIDLIIAKGLAEDFCLANIIKYASRFKKTQKLEDLRKISDYAHILCGVKINEGEAEVDNSQNQINAQRQEKLPIINQIHTRF